MPNLSTLTTIICVNAHIFDMNYAAIYQINARQFTDGKYGVRYVYTPYSYNSA